MPVVSVIVPCYNQGPLVDEAVDSVLAQTFSDFEIIIVNDGSTDEETNRILKAYDKPQTTVLHTPNCGLGGARNNGIRAARGKYILPLDADDRIGSTYLEQAVQVLETNDNLGIVYCRVEHFGERTGEWKMLPYKFPDILLFNVIICSAFFRKSDWERTVGYRANVPAWEDYDFWLSIIELGRDVYCIPDVLFYYRQQAGSMIKSMTREQYVRNHSQIMRNHSQLYLDNAEFMAEHIMALEEEVQDCYLELVLDRLLHDENDQKYRLIASQLQKRIKHGRTRASWADQRYPQRALAVFAELAAGRYHLCAHPDSNAWRDAITDLVPYKFWPDRER